MGKENALIGTDVWRSRDVRFRHKGKGDKSVGVLRSALIAASCSGDA